jgi:hypothetical protein
MSSDDVQNSGRLTARIRAWESQQNVCTCIRFRRLSFGFGIMRECRSTVVHFLSSFHVLSGTIVRGSAGRVSGRRRRGRQKTRRVQSHPLSESTSPCRWATWWVVFLNLCWRLCESHISSRLSLAEEKARLIEAAKRERVGRPYIVVRTRFIDDAIAEWCARVKAELASASCSDRNVDAQGLHDDDVSSTSANPKLQVTGRVRTRLQMVLVGAGTMSPALRPLLSRCE